MFFDAALVYDRDTRRCDLAIGSDGDLVIDDTAITPMLLSIGLDRRAAPDDPLPAGRDVFSTIASFSARRGAPGDGLDPFAALSGCKMWLLDRAKETDATRLLCAMYLTEAMAWAEDETGTPATIEVEWVRTGVLSYRVVVADAAVRQSVEVG